MITTMQPQATEISTVDALWVLIQSQTKAVRKALAKRLLAEEEVSRVQKANVRKSMTKAFDELNSSQIKHNARELFAK